MSAAPAEEDAGADVVSQCIGLLSRKDDTSRFVGLAMMLSIAQRVSEPAIVLESCAKALNPVFLDRLLKAGVSGQKSEEEARDMVELAVNVLNAFALSLPDAEENKSLVGRVPALIAVIPNCSALTVATILQVLVVFATGSAGAKSIIETEDLGPIVDASVTQNTAIQVLQHAFINASSSVPGITKERLERFLDTLCTKLDGCDRPLKLNIFSILSELLVRVPSELLPTSTAWVTTLYTTILTMLTTNPNATERRYCTIITASLLHSYPPTLLFHSSHTHSSSDKPSIYILLQHLTIDLRASFPSLLEQLASPSYHSTIQRLAAAFDIIASFLTFLIHAEDFSTIPISPDLLIKLRTDLSETFGLTVEFLRDRWDAAYAGAAGFEPGFEEGALKGLTWDSTISGGPERDALIVGAVRALSVWLKEDESLRGEAGGLMDVFLGLWSKGIEAGVDYRAWLVGALSGVLEEPNGRTIFVKLMGWKVVWEDLRSIYNTEPDEEELQLGIEEARILVGFVKSERFGNEGWARELAGVVVSGSREARGRRLELEVMVLSLASAVVAGTHGASGSFLRREVEGLRRVQKRMEAAASGEEEGDELVDILEDVFHELKM